MRTPPGREWRPGYAVIFGVVLVLVLAVTFLAGRWALARVRQDLGPRAVWTPAGDSSVPSATPDATVALPASTATASKGHSTATRVVIVTPMPGATPTSDARGNPTASPTLSLTPATTSPENGLTATPTVTTTLTPTPTATAMPDFQYVPALLRNSTNDCPGNYILGRVTDAGGTPRANVQLWLIDEFGNQDHKTTKGEGPDAGRYDFPIFGPPRHFYVTVVGANGQPISPKVEISHGLGADAAATCHWVDWRAQ